MTKKTAKRKEPKADDTGAAPSPVTPPEGFSKTMDLRTIDGVLHQKYESPHPGENQEHWQPVEEWTTDSEGEQTRSEA